MTSQTGPATESTKSLDAAVGEFRGRCGLCGHPDARHRRADAAAEFLRAGGDPTEAQDEIGPGVRGVTPDEIGLSAAVAAAWGEGGWPVTTEYEVDRSNPDYDADRAVLVLSEEVTRLRRVVHVSHGGVATLPESAAVDSLLAFAARVCEEFDGKADALRQEARVGPVLHPEQVIAHYERVTLARSYAYRDAGDIVRRLWQNQVTPGSGT